MGRVMKIGINFVDVRNIIMLNLSLPGYRVLRIMRNKKGCGPGPKYKSQFFECFRTIIFNNFEKNRFLSTERGELEIGMFFNIDVLFN